MNVDLNHYLSLVLRNEVKNPIQENPIQNSQPSFHTIIDTNTNAFIVDRKYSLGLDEII